MTKDLEENIKNGIEWYYYNGWRDPDYVVVLCMNCENVTTFKPLSNKAMKNILMNRCNICTNVPEGKIGRFNFWYEDGTPIGHDTQMTPRQLKYTVKL